MTQLPLDEHYRRRLRRSSRTVSWILLPLSVAAGTAWIIVTAVICGNDRATSPFEIGFCGWTQTLPDSAALFVAAGVGLIVWTLVSLQQITNPRARGTDEWLITHYVKTPHHGYLGLDDRHKRLVRGSVEASVWVAAMMIALFMFYWLEFSIPLGLLGIAGFIRLVYAGGRHVIAARRAKKAVKGDFSDPQGASPSTAT